MLVTQFVLELVPSVPYCIWRGGGGDTKDSEIILEKHQMLSW